MGPCNEESKDDEAGTATNATSTPLSSASSVSLNTSGGRGGSPPELAPPVDALSLDTAGRLLPSVVWRRTLRDRLLLSGAQDSEAARLRRYYVYQPHTRAASSMPYHTAISGFAFIRTCSRLPSGGISIFRVFSSEPSQCPPSCRRSELEALVGDRALLLL